MYASSASMRKVLLATIAAPAPRYPRREWKTSAYVSPTCSGSAAQEMSLPPQPRCDVLKAGEEVSYTLVLRVL